MHLVFKLEKAACSAIVFILVFGFFILPLMISYTFWVKQMNKAVVYIFRLLVLTTLLNMVLK